MKVFQSKLINAKDSEATKDNELDELEIGLTLAAIRHLATQIFDKAKLLLVTRSNQQALRS